jgi:glycosyltransferase involved in cell wall biosynthesis
MDPARVDTTAARRELGTDKRIVMFMGTPRPHKGIEELIAAVERLQRHDVVCAVIGIDSADPYSGVLRQSGGENVRLLPMQPFNHLPEYLVAADVVVIPQRTTAFTQAQMPAKLYDAMALARPIVATALSDIPQTLDGCGLVVPPDNVEQLSAAIGYLLDHPAEARRLGEAARARCVHNYSWDALERTLQPLVERLQCRR